MIINKLPQGLISAFPFRVHALHLHIDLYIMVLYSTCTF